MAHALKRMQFLDLRLLHPPVAMGDGHLHAIFQLSAMHTAHGDTALITRVVERGDEHLRRTLYLLRSGDDLHDLIEQIGDIICRCLPILTHPAVLGRAIHHGEIQLILCGIEREHQVEHHLIDLLWAAVGLVHLVHHDDRFEAYLKSLLQYEPCLGHRTLEGVYKQQTAIGHIQHTLYLASEIGVSRRIYDIDFNSFPINTHVLGENGDATLSFKIVSVEHLIAEILSLTEEISSQHHLIDQGCLTMVYMRNDCDISDILHRL